MLDKCHRGLIKRDQVAHFIASLKNRLRSRTHVATLRFQSALRLKNRLRSRTRVAILRFQNALSLRIRLRSRTRVATLRFQSALRRKILRHPFGRVLLSMGIVHLSSECSVSVCECSVEVCECSLSADGVWSDPTELQLTECCHSPRSGVRAHAVLSEQTECSV